MNKLRIQNAIVTMVKAGLFYQVTYNKTTDLANDIDTTTAPVIAPKSVQCNEVESGIGVDQKYGQDLKLERKSWVFHCFATFNVEITDEVFIQSLMDAIPFYAADNAFKSFKLILLSVQSDHPVKQSGGGSEVKYTFQAQLGRN